MLTLNNVTVGHDGKPLLTDVNLTVEAGETVCLTGPSGLGKTTLLRVAAGLLPPMSGSVSNSFASTAFAFQDDRLLPWLSAADNLLFTLPAKRPRAEALEWLSRLELPQESWKLKPAELSGGMQKRVNLARALAIAPELLILDEPFNSLDELLAQRCWNQIQQWQKENHSAILVVSHSLTLFQNARIVRLISN